MIEVKDVFAGYRRGIDILQGISLKADKERITIIIGANGTGKSTLLKTIYGFLRPTRGKIYYNHEDITGAKPNWVSMKGISYVMQRISIFPYLTVEENLELGGWAFRKNKKLIKQRILENYDRFPVLSQKRNAGAYSLSGGTKRLLQIARGLMIDPGMLLLDEPTAGLAPRVAGHVYEILEKLRSLERRGILLVDQNVRQAMEIADYIHVIEMGKNKAQGTRLDFNTDLKEMIKDWL